MNNLFINENNEITDGARVEVSLISPKWIPILRYRFYMNHKPEDHLTVWHTKWAKYIGSYTPPGWFLKLIGQVK